MSRDLSILATVDTEGDDEWTFHRAPTSDNISFLPHLDRAFRRVGARPTYLVTHTVVENPKAAETLREIHAQGHSEIGAHCHAWNTPPVAEPEGSQPFLNELPEAAQRKKLENLTQAIERAMGVRPTSFRGGRYGVNAATIRCLRDLGYHVDSSVTPGVSWRRTPGLPGGEGGPDFRGAPVGAYFVDPDDPCRPGNGDVLEIPVTVVRTRRLPPLMDRLLASFGPASRVSGVAGKLGFGQVLWFGPTFQPLEEIVEAAEVALDRGANVFTLTLHSSEVMPGGSPYFKNEAEVSALIDRTERAVEIVMEKTGAVPRTMEEFRKIVAGASSDQGGTEC